MLLIFWFTNLIHRPTLKISLKHKLDLIFPSILYFNFYFNFTSIHKTCLLHYILLYLITVHNFSSLFMKVIIVAKTVEEDSCK